MATILERFNHLGLAVNKSSLSWCGEAVSKEFKNRNLWGRQIKEQLENGSFIKVWDYPSDWVKEMDAVIIKTIERGQTS